MAIKRQILKLGGIVRISVKGSSVERFLNICLRYNLKLFNIKKIQIDEFNADIALKHFKQLPKVIGKTGCTMKVINKSGLPFVLKSLKKRYMLFGGTMFLAVAWFILSNFIWVIDMDIPPDLSAYKVQQTLDKIGIHIGMKVSDLQSRDMQYEMLKLMPEIQFVAFNRQGNSLKVELFSAIPKPEMIDSNIMTDVRAQKSGVITEIIATNGQAVKTVGETVTTGEIVISSLIEPLMEGGVAHLSHAQGEVYARVWYEKQALLDTNRYEKQYLTDEVKRYAILFGKKRINLYLGSSIYSADCDKIVEETKLEIADNVFIPVTLICETVQYYETIAMPQDIDSIQEDINKRAQERLNTTGEITQIDVQIEELDGGVKVTTYAECIEQIGMQAIAQPFIIEDIPNED